jgi:2-polyprenyl-3-methyl-5-hydroxy-6-metoxy-1,4-benzoquinol methylase
MKFSKQKLEEVATNSLYTTITNSRTITYSGDIAKRFIHNTTSVLEYGPAEGLMTSQLIQLFDRYVIVEGSEKYCEELKRKFPSAEIINGLFENTILHEKFDFIVLGHVLEHVEDPVEVLKIVANHMHENSVVFCAVPNANSIHRLAAVEMGLMETEYDMSEKDIHHGHMRIYKTKSLISDFESADLQIVEKGGYWLKPISDNQIEESWTQEMLDAFMKLGEVFPEIAAEIYVVATKK